MKREFTVVTTKHVKLTFHYVGRVATSWSWSIVASSNFFPVISIYIKDVHIIHPMNTIVASEVVNF